MNLFKKNNKKNSSGFTLVELLVTISILVVITSISLAGYSSFGSSTELKNAAHELSISILNARIYGIGSVSQKDSYDKSYGIHFDKNSSNSYLIFIDLDEDSLYSGTSENVKVVSINKKFEIGKICGILPGGSTNCSPGINYLDILFKRPLPEVIINSDTQSNYKEAEIYLSAGGSETSVIKINLTGRIMAN